MKTVHAQIGKFKYSIMQVKHTSAALTANGEQNLGIHNYAHGTICLSDFITKDVLETTLTHEIAHAYLCTHIPVELTRKQKELICEFISLYGKDIILKTEEVLQLLEKTKDD